MIVSRRRTVGRGSLLATIFALALAACSDATSSALPELDCSHRMIDALVREARAKNSGHSLTPEALLHVALMWGDFDLDALNALWEADGVHARAVWAVATDPEESHPHDLGLPYINVSVEVSRAGVPLSATADWNTCELGPPREDQWCDAIQGCCWVMREEVCDA